MSRKNPKMLKRKQYVSQSSRESAKDTDCRSSDDDWDEVPQRKKVRDQLTVWELIKESEKYKRDADHLYTKSHDEDKSDGTVNYNPSVRLTRLRNVKSPSLVEDEGKKNVSPNKRQKCFSKNAVMARLNRAKKKQYISTLQSNNEYLQKKNSEILQKVHDQDRVIATLKREVLYLKSLLANSKELSDILRSLKSTGLPVSSSLRSSVSAESFEQLDEEIPSGMCDKLPEESSVMQCNVKKVTSGVNFPIMKKDVNLGYSSSKDDDVWQQYMQGESRKSIMENDFSVDDTYLNDLDLDFEDSLFKSFEPVSCYIDNENKELTTEDNVDTDAGLCLHVNRHKISVELCGLCNRRASAQAQ